MGRAAPANVAPVVCSAGPLPSEPGRAGRNAGGLTRLGCYRRRFGSRDFALDRSARADWWQQHYGYRAACYAAQKARANRHAQPARRPPGQWLPVRKRLLCFQCLLVCMFKRWSRIFSSLLARISTVTDLSDSNPNSSKSHLFFTTTAMSTPSSATTACPVQSLQHQVRRPHHWPRSPPGTT